MTDAHTAEYDNDSMKAEKGRPGSGNSEGVATAALCVPSSGKLHLAVQEKCFFGEYEIATWKYFGSIRRMLWTG